MIGYMSEPERHRARNLNPLNMTDEDREWFDDVMLETSGRRASSLSRVSGPPAGPLES